MRVLNRVTGTLPTGGTAASYFVRAIVVLIDLLGILPVLVKATTSEAAAIMSR